MKLFFTLAFLVSSFFCFGQIKSENLVGNWESDGGTILNDSTRHISVKKFILSIKKNKSFQIQSNKKTINGKWILKDSVLYLVEKIENKNIKKNSLRISSLTRAKLILKPEGIKSEKALLKLVRVKRK